MDDAIGEVQPDEGFAAALRGAENCEQSARDVVLPDPLDAWQESADVAQGGNLRREAWSCAENGLQDFLLIGQPRGDPTFQQVCQGCVKKRGFASMGKPARRSAICCTCIRVVSMIPPLRRKIKYARNPCYNLRTSMPSHHLFAVPPNCARRHCCLYSSNPPMPFQGL